MVQPNVEGPHVPAVKAPAPTPANARAIFPLTDAFTGILPTWQEGRADEGTTRHSRIGQWPAQEALEGHGGIAVVEDLTEPHTAAVGELRAKGGVDVIERVVRADKHPSQGVDRKRERAPIDPVALFPDGYPAVALRRRRGAGANPSRPAGHLVLPHHRVIGPPGVVDRLTGSVKGRLMGEGGKGGG